MLNFNFLSYVRDLSVRVPMAHMLVNFSREILSVLEMADAIQILLFSLVSYLYQKLSLVLIPQIPYIQRKFYLVCESITIKIESSCPQLCVCF